MDMGKEESYQELAKMLERAGYKDALALIQNVLVPLAYENHISIDAAITMYEDSGEEQDTSWHELYVAMRQIPVNDLMLYSKLDIHSPL